jgi:hypothetical protein
MNDEWEHGIKRLFDVTKAIWPIDIQGDRYVFSKWAHLSSLTQPSTEANRDNVEPLFQPVCGEIRSLINRQVRQVKEKTLKPPKVSLHCSTAS